MPREDTLKFAMPSALVSAALAGVFVAGPAEAGATQFTAPYATSFSTCSGSTVYLTGLVHYKESAPESDYEYNYRLSGTDTITGAAYRFDANVIGMFTSSPDGTAVEETFLRQVRLTGLAGAESLVATAVVHVTQVDGTVTADISRISVRC
jgi:hypothetical protein